MLSLPNVTLVAVSSVDLDKTLFALSYSSHEIEFGAVKLLTSKYIQPSNSKIVVELTPDMDIWGYSKFVLMDLHRYIHTQYCLLIQADGFVLNASKWNPSFLEYDYVGAPWPPSLTILPWNLSINLTKNQVGNGGFSLRSKALLQETAKIDYDSLEFPCTSEDIIICHYLYDQMKSAGMKFPSPQLASQFSIESINAASGDNLKSSFGFHGKHLLNKVYENILG